MCTEDSPSGLWRTLGKRVGCKPSGVRIPHPPPLTPGPVEVPGFLLLVALLVFPGAASPARPRAVRAASRPRHELRSARRLEARPGPAGLAAASNRAGHVAVSGQALSPPARSPHASFARSGRSRSPPVPSGPSGARHSGGACRRPRALLPGLGGSLAGINRAAIALPRPSLVPRETCVKRRGRAERTPGLDPTCLDPETLDDLRSRERGKDLARHKELRTP